jgi:hypothetical protein
MKDPIKGQSLPYIETQWELPKSNDFNVVSFSRDYANSWIVRGTVTRGQRLLDKQLLLGKQLELLSNVDAGTVDYAASLCGYIYSVLEGELFFQDSVVIDLAEKIDSYLDLNLQTPHHIRWNVSISFAAGLLFKQKGDFNKAYHYFEMATEFKVTLFSPLLGNKTLDAHFEMAKIALSLNKKDKARAHLTCIVKDAISLSKHDWLNIIGDTDKPCSFGFPEMAQLMDKAARAVYMLENFDSIANRPELIATESKGYYERIMNSNEGIISEQDKGLSNLYSEVDRLNNDNKVYIREIHRLNDEIKNMTTIDNGIRQSFFYRGLRYVYRRAKLILK